MGNWQLEKFDLKSRVRLSGKKGTYPDFSLALGPRWVIDNPHIDPRVVKELPPDPQLVDVCVSAEKGY